MNEQEIIDLVKKAAQNVLDHDSWLLTKDLSEPSISHKFAEHLQTLFSSLHVDCEYNGDAATDGRKKIYVLNRELREKGFLKETEIEKDPVDRGVFPGIIIHRRGTHEQNICVIEVKKSTSGVSFEYDYIKLKAYTSNHLGNELSYQLGIFIYFQTNTQTLDFSMKYFKEGEEIKEPL